MRFICKAAALLSAVMFICSCSEINTVGEETESVTVITETDRAETPVNDYPVTIGDVKIDCAPEKTVVLSPAAAEIVCAVGCGGKIKAVGKYCDYPELLKDVPQTGSAANPDIEKIISLSPQAVITESPIARKDITDLKDAGITVIKLDPPTDYNGLFEEYRTVAAVFCGNTAADEIAEKALSEYKAAIYGENNYIGKFVLIMDGELHTAGENTFAGNFLSRFGENVSDSDADNNGSMTADGIFSADPDTVFLSVNADQAEFLRIFGDLRAVKSQRVFVIDTALFEHPTARLAGIVNEINRLPAVGE